MVEQHIVHRFPVVRDGAFVNAYLVETAAGVVAVDSLLTISDSRAMRQALERLGKPLQAVLLTHSHPDHYAVSRNSSPRTMCRSSRRRG
jgi:glyoxylase-like metal-dependent hydrolase (beta-lactamase superfamily II)